MAYTKVNWSSTKPMNVTNLNTMDSGIKANDTAIGNLTSNVDTLNNQMSGKQATISSGTSLPSTVTDGAIFLLYEE